MISSGARHGPQPHSNYTINIEKMQAVGRPNAGWASAKIKRYMLSEEAGDQSRPLGYCFPGTIELNMELPGITLTYFNIFQIHVYI